MIFRKIQRFTLLLCLVCVAIGAQTIAEKKAGLKSGGDDLDTPQQQLLKNVNEDITDRQKLLKELYAQVDDLYQSGANEEDFRSLVEEIAKVKREIGAVEEVWREQAEDPQDSEDYALWHQPETTIDQLIIDYGSQEYVYLIPPELGAIKVGVSSNLPVPKASWDDMLNFILGENGVGIKQLNPYLRQLIPLENDLSGLSYITSSRKELQAFPENSRVAMVLTPETSDVHRLYNFLLKFSDSKRVQMQLFGGSIFVVGHVNAVQELLKLYDFTARGYGDTDYRFVALTKIQAEEMASILNAVFNKPASKSKKSKGDSKDSGSDGPQVIALPNVARGLFLLGSQRELAKAEEIIREVEMQLGEVREKTVFWYVAKHSDASELADVLDRVYALIEDTQLEKDGEAEDSDRAIQDVVSRGVPVYGGALTIVNPATVQPNLFDKEKSKDKRHNFIVDEKTGAIVMVVETDILPKIKDLLKRLDVPKKMVKIDVLLFEKRMSGTNKIGLNLLRLGDDASNVNQNGLTWFGCSGSNKGILEYTLSRMTGSSRLPAYDLAYNFLMSQEDIQINASPSVTTINQTPAEIAVVDEISLNSAVYEDTGDNSRLREAYARMQYGIIIKVTPTIHSSHDDRGEVDHITLATDVTFDQVQASSNSRPDVTRRHITNEVRVADGETIILGGLRRKTQQDGRESIPFLGEIPGVGKLFSCTEMQDSSTEMFVFITPTIIEDTSEVLERIRCEELTKRPGDTPEVLRCLIEAKEMERGFLFEQGMQMFLGRPKEWCIPTCCGEYDGRSCH